MGYFTDYMILGTYLNSGDAADCASEAANNTYEMLRIQEQQLQHYENQKDLKQLIFSINKKFKRLENSDNDDEYKYIELFFIMKDLNDCGVTEEDFDELSDKQYYLDMSLSMENCAKELVKKLGTEKINYANQYINAIFEKEYIRQGIEVEKAKNELDEIEKVEKEKFSNADKKNKKNAIILGMIGLIPILFATVLLILTSMDPCPIADFINKIENFETLIICFGLLGIIFILLIPIFCRTEHDRDYFDKKNKLEKILMNNPDYTESQPISLEELSVRQEEINKILSVYGDDFCDYLKKTYLY